MDTLLSIVRRHLVEHDYRPEKKGQSLRVCIDGYNGVWFLWACVNEDDRWLVCQSMLPVKVPPELRNAAAVFITRANYGLILGGFELDMKDGEVSYKTSVRLSADELTDTMVKDLLYGNFSTFDRMLPGFMALIHGKRSVRQALKIVGQPIEDAPPEPAPAESDSAKDTSQHDNETP